MKKTVFIALSLGAVMVLTGCKSRESLYRQAYEEAKAQEMEQSKQQAAQNTQVVEVKPASQQEPKVVPITGNNDTSDTRTIPGGFEVTSGEQLKTFSVVVGSFVTEANASGLAQRLKAKGYEARVLKTNEVINGQTPWYRVVASSYHDKASAIVSRDELKADFPGAWLLYNK